MDDMYLAKVGLCFQRNETTLIYLLLPLYSTPSVSQQENLILSQDCPMVSCQTQEQLKQKMKRKWHEAMEANQWQGKLKVFFPYL